MREGTFLGSITSAEDWAADWGRWPPLLGSWSHTPLFGGGQASRLFVGGRFSRGAFVLLSPRSYFPMSPYETLSSVHIHLLAHLDASNPPAPTHTRAPLCAALFRALLPRRQLQGHALFSISAMHTTTFSPASWSRGPSFAPLLDGIRPAWALKVCQGYQEWRCPPNS